MFRIFILACITISALKTFTTALNPLTESIYSSYPGNCNLYYEKQTLECPPNLYWSSKFQRCDTIYNSDCSAPTVKPSYEVQDPDLTQLCKNQLGMFIPYPGNCRQFIQCDYLPFVKICPEYLYWNSELLTCDKMCV